MASFFKKLFSTDMDVRLPLEEAQQAEKLESQGNYVAALDIYEAFLKRHPDSLQALNNAGLLLMRLRNPQKACQLFEKATHLNPKYIKSWNNLGTARVMLGNGIGAKEAFEQTLKYDPRNMVAQKNLQMLLSRGIPPSGRNIRFVEPT